MPEDFITPGMASVNLGGKQWKSGQSFSQFIEDLNKYTRDKSKSESDYGAAGEAIGMLGFLTGNPIIGAITSQLGGWGGRMVGEHQAGDAPSREDYDIMFGEGALQDIESQFAADEEQYSDMNQFLKSLGVTTNVLMSLYGPQFLGEIFAGGGAATAKAGAASALESGLTAEGVRQAGTSALGDYWGSQPTPGRLPISNNWENFI